MTDAPTTIAHRGFAGQFPENTVAAVQGAVAAGADAVEIDVQPTADGDVVVFHDQRLDEGSNSRGITDETGYVWEQPTDVITEAQVLGTDETVPRLSTLLGAVPDDVLVNVELKNPGTTAIRPAIALGPDERRTAAERWRPFVESVLSITDDAAVDVLFSSFCEGALAALGELATAVDVAALVGATDADDGLTHATRYDVDAIHVPVSLASEQAVAETAADLGAAVNVYTVTDWREAAAAVAAGADGLIADYPGLETYAAR